MVSACCANFFFIILACVIGLSLAGIAIASFQIGYPTSLVIAMITELFSGFLGYYITTTWGYPEN